MEMLEKLAKPYRTIAILSLVKAIFEKRAATVEVDTFSFPVLHPKMGANFQITLH